MANATNAINMTTKDSELIITRTLTVASGETIYEGTLVFIDGSGYATATAGTIVAGIAQDTVAAGYVVTVEFNHTIRIALSGIASTDVGGTAYASDNQTATTSSNSSILGPIVDYETDYAWVKLSTRA